MPRSKITTTIDSDLKQQLNLFCRESRNTLASVIENALILYLSQNSSNTTSNTTNIQESFTETDNHNTTINQESIREPINTDDSYMTREEIEAFWRECWDDRATVLLEVVNETIDKKHDRLLAQINEKLPLEIEHLVRQYTRNGKRGKGFG